MNIDIHTIEPVNPEGPLAQAKNAVLEAEAELSRLFAAQNERRAELRDIRAALAGMKGDEPDYAPTVARREALKTTGAAIDRTIAAQKTEIVRRQKDVVRVMSAIASRRSRLHRAQRHERTLATELEELKNRIKNKEADLAHTHSRILEIATNLEGMT